jgi:hypothetical protein
VVRKPVRPGAHVVGLAGDRVVERELRQQRGERGLRQSVGWRMRSDALARSRLPPSTCCITASSAPSWKACHQGAVVTSPLSGGGPLRGRIGDLDARAGGGERGEQEGREHQAPSGRGAAPEHVDRVVHVGLVGQGREGSAGHMRPEGARLPGGDEHHGEHVWILRPEQAAGDAALEPGGDHARAADGGRLGAAAEHGGVRHAVRAEDGDAGGDRVVEGERAGADLAELIGRGALVGAVRELAEPGVGVGRLEGGEQQPLLGAEALEERGLAEAEALGDGLNGDGGTSLDERGAGHVEDLLVAELGGGRGHSDPR